MKYFKRMMKHRNLVWAVISCTVFFSFQLFYYSPAFAATAVVDNSTDYHRADLNGDGAVDVLDVMACVNAVLEIEANARADVNQDSHINILDIMEIVNEMMGSVGTEGEPIINEVAHEQQIMQGNTYTFTPTLSQGQNVKWYKAYGPDDVEVDGSNGKVTWSIPGNLPGEAFYIGVKACNDYGCDTETWILKVGTGDFVYIDPNLATGDNNGTSWENAYQSVKAGASAAETKSGDTIIIRNGVYADNDNRIYNDPGSRGSVPPSGAPTAYTTIMAETPGGVLFDGEGIRRPIRLKGSHDTGRGSTSPSTIEVSYIAVKGFVAGRSSSAGAIGLGSVHHIKLIYCGAYDQAADSGAIIGMGYSSNVLVESCYAYGHGRELMAAFMSDHVIFRRCVGRTDRSTSSEPIGGFVHYAGRDSITANCIVIDSDQPQYWLNHTYLAGAFCNDCGAYCYYDFGQIENIITTHCLALNNYGKLIAKSNSRGNSLGVEATYDNIVAWDMKAWYGNGAHTGDPTAMILSRGDISIDQSTFGVFSSPAGSTDVFFNSWQDDDPAIGDSLSNSIIYDIKNYNDVPGDLFWDWNRVDFNNIYDTGDISAYSTVDTNTINSDPTSNGLQYITRIESDAPLQTAGQNGTRIGADLTYMYGKSGTMWGEPGFNEETTTPMWPFPAEDLIKEKMASYSYDNGNLNGVRGFAADLPNPGTPTGKETLTSYIWEYLGNEIPCEIYETCR